ncbi:MAG TPA: hypothetical protein VF988_05435 [Verrucomicrobiae bacterium]
MSRIFVAGVGAVSPAGWGVPVLRGALEKAAPLPVQTLARPGWEKTLPVRLVPNPPARPEFLAHPRLRRTSPITHYAAASALEAMAALRANPAAKHLRLGVVCCLQSGCVQYSCRFYEEVLKDPATASPLVFPETVYAAPTSHVAALLENVVLAYSLVGDPSSFLQGVALGAEWLGEDRADLCLVLGAEEPNWVIADAMHLLDRTAITAAGAGALCLCKNPDLSNGVELATITDAHTFGAKQTRAQAALAMREELCRATRPASGASGTIASPSAGLLCDGLGTSVIGDAAESAAWSDWNGARVSPKKIFGDGLMAGAAWQCVAACDLVAAKKFAAATVSLVGSNQQAIAARFTSAG